MLWTAYSTLSLVYLARIAHLAVEQDDANLRQALVNVAGAYKSHW